MEVAAKLSGARISAQKARHLRTALAGGGGSGRLHAARTQGQAKADHQRAYGGAGQETTARQVDRVSQTRDQGQSSGIDANVHQASPFCARSCTAA